MSHSRHWIELTLLAKLKHKDLEREADVYRLAQLASASPSAWGSISRYVARLREQLSRNRAKQPALTRAGSRFTR
jgi:hypothetical protein